MKGLRLHTARGPAFVNKYINEIEPWRSSKLNTGLVFGLGHGCWSIYRNPLRQPLRELAATSSQIKSTD